MANILVICTANICRSPVVEGLITDRLEKQGYTNWTIHSAGTWAQNGRSVTQYSAEVMQEIENIDIFAHSARMVTAEILGEADLVLCMTKNHVEALRVEFHDHAAKIYLLSQMVDNRRYNIADPYGSAKPNYVRMYKQVKDLVEQGLPRIVELAQ